MNNKASGRSGRTALIAAERQRRIHEWAVEYGSVSVSRLAAVLNVAENTVRHDLAALEEQGKLIRSHGGAVIKGPMSPCPPYAQVRQTHMLEKSWIGEAALRYVPHSGMIFINAGTTAHQLAIRLPESRQIEIATNSPEIATYLASNVVGKVVLLGGQVNPESLAADYSFSADVLDRLYWDVSFMGVSAVDVERGITTSSVSLAQHGFGQCERKIMENSRKTVVLCDSSKFGRFSNVKVGPVSLIDVLITDPGVSPDVVQQLTAQGVEVVVAEPAHNGLGMDTSEANQDEPH